MKMRKWGKAILFLLPVLFLVAAVNWYVDSYAMLRITYDQIGEQMAVYGANVEGLEESDFNDRNLFLACVRKQEGPREVIVAGSSRVMNFDHTMFGTDSFYNAGLSEATVYDLLAVTGVLEAEDKLPKTMVIGVDAFLFNTSHDNERWKDLYPYANYMGVILDGKFEAGNLHPQKNTGTDMGKWLSLDYFRYNVTLLPERKRFQVSYTNDWESERYLKHYDGSIAYQRQLREGDVATVEELTRQSMEEHVVYRLTDYKEIDYGHWERFEKLIAWLQEEGVEVILYLPPYSPMMYNYIESEEAFQIALEVEEKVQELAKERQIALYGSYDPAGCDLDMTDLYDIYHVKTDKMMDTFYPVILPE